MSINRSKQKKLGNTNAVPTTIGWVDPDKGELLVSIRGLPGAYVWDRKTNTFTKGGQAVKLGKSATEAKAKPAPKEPTVEKSKSDEINIKDQKVVKEFVKAADPVEGAKLEAEQAAKKTKKATKPRKKKSDKAE